MKIILVKIFKLEDEMSNIGHYLTRDVVIYIRHEVAYCVHSEMQEA
jgi:hypothetical protein